MASVQRLKTLALANTNYRAVIDELSTPNLQVALMCVTEKDARIPREVHKNATQFISIVAGCASLITGDDRAETMLLPDTAVTITPGLYHEIVVHQELKLFTIYSPPMHTGANRLVARRTDDGEEDEDE